MLLVCAFLLSVAQVRVQSPDLLVEARAAYNAGRFEVAIQKAEEARRQPAFESEASLVIARAQLGIYRGSREQAALDAARTALARIAAADLTSRDTFEFHVGLGQALYYGDPPHFGASADFFQLALRSDGARDAAERQQIFEWWAGAIDRQAQFSPPLERRAVYQRLLEGAERERERHPDSAAAWYWLALAARGADELERAWGHAMAGWLRAPQLGESGVVLRADLDRLVTQVILPERARRLAPEGDAHEALAVLKEHWAQFKAQWKSEG